VKIRVGTDVVSIERMQKSIEKESFIKKVFTSEEIQYAQNKNQPAASFAARFAAKEAFFKALGSGLYSQGMGPRDVWIQNNSNGRPALHLSEAAEQQLKTLGSKYEADVSLAHDGGIATATVVLVFAD